MTKGYTWRSVNHNKREVIRTLKGKKSAIFFDTESTGIAKNGILEDDIKIIQFSGILYDISYKSDGSIQLIEKETLNLYINPEELVSETVSKLTGITNEMLVNAEIEAKVAWKIVRFMEKSDLWVAFNTPYDLKRLQGMKKRTGLDFVLPDDDNPAAPTWLDVLQIARDTVNPDTIISYKKARGDKSTKMYKLDILTPMLIPDFHDKMHDSMNDVRATALLFELLYPTYMELDMPCGDRKLKVRRFTFRSSNARAYMKNRRIIVYTSPEDASDGAYAEDCGIYWDVSNSCWSCKTKAKGDNRNFKHIFTETDLQDLEDQVLSLAKKQGYTDTNEFNILSMDTLVYEAERRWKETKEGKMIMKQVTSLNRDKRVNVRLETQAQKFAAITVD